MSAPATKHRHGGCLFAFYLYNKVMQHKLYQNKQLVYMEAFHFNIYVATGAINNEMDMSIMQYVITLLILPEFASRGVQ